MLSIRLFGTPAVRFNDQPLQELTRSPTQISLFAFLVTYRDRPHSRSILAAMFWPDVPESRARRNLNNALWELRRALKISSTATDGYLLSDSQNIQFNAEAPFWLDVAEFSVAATTRCQNHQPDHNSADEKARQLDSAAQLYRGDFLEGAYADWCLAPREQLREQYLLVLETLTHTYRASGRHEAALRAAQQLAQTEPLREEAHFQIIQLCLLLGKPPEAWAHYHRYESIWRNELMTAPSARMKPLSFQLTSDAQILADPLADEELIQDRLLIIEALASLDDLPQPPESAPEKILRNRLWEQIAEAGERAGRTLRANYNHADALKYFSLAIDALSHLSETGERCQRELAIRCECDELFDLIADRPGQAQNLDRADYLAEKLGAVTAQIDLLARRAWLMTRTACYAEAVALLRQMLQLCRTSNQAGPQEALAHRLLGITFDEMGDFRAAFEHHRQALALDETSANSQGVYLDLNNLATVLTTMGNYSTARCNLERAQTFVTVDTSLLVRAIIMGNIGNLWTKLGCFPVAADKLKEAMRLAQQAGDRETECWLGGRLANLYYKRGEIDRALLMAHHYYQVAMDIEASHRMIELAELLAILYCELKNGKRALAWANTVDNLAHTIKCWRYQMRGAMRQAQAFCLLDEKNKALDFARQAVSEFEQRAQLLEEEPELFYILAQCALPAKKNVSIGRARSALLRQVNWIENSELRQGFLSNHSLHRALLMETRS